MSDKTPTKKGRKPLGLTEEEKRERKRASYKRYCEKLGKEKVAERQRNFYQNNEEFRTKKLETMARYRATKRGISPTNS